MCDIQKIIDGCNEHNIPCSNFLASFIAQSIIVNKADDDYLVSKSIQKILEYDFVSLETIKMQISFEVGRFTDDRNKLMKRERLVKSKKEMVQKLVSSTFSTFHSSDIKKLEKYRKDILMFVLKISSLLEEGDETKEKKDGKVEKEITTAFDAILPLSAIKSFIFFSENEKKNQLQELPKLILGMRVNNKMLEKGGAGIQDIDEICHKKSIQSLNEVDTEISESSEICDRLKEKILSSLNKTDNDRNADDNIYASYDIIKSWINEHTFWKQYIYSMQCIKHDIEQYFAKLVNVRHEFHAIINDLQRLIKKRTTIPKEHVYPKFITIANIWETLHLDYYGIALSFSNCINDLWKHKNTINTYVSNQKYIKSKSSIEISNKNSSLHDETTESISKIQKSSLDDEISTPVRINAHSTPNFIELPLELNGYCCWTIATKHRLLHLGNPEIGLVKYQGKYYAFSNQDALVSFMKFPTFYLECVRSLALRHSELIHLLRLQSTFPGLSLKTIVLKILKQSNKPQKFSAVVKVSKSVNSIILFLYYMLKQTDKCVQCPTHFQQSFIDQDYHWNEWEVRKNFLDMVTEQNQRSGCSHQAYE